MSDNPVTIAQQQIAGILAELERETGDWVTGIEIIDTDISTYAQREVMRRVRIETRPKPGTRRED